MKRLYGSLLVAAVTLSPAINSARAEPVAGRDGQHDFDFAVGTWKSHVRRLQHPLTGSSTWTDGTGTVSVRRIWNGKAQLEEIEVDWPAGHLEGLTLRLYNPGSRQWRLHWANASRSVLAQPPSVGEFKEGRGEFYDQEEYEGKTILVRQVYFDIAPDSYRFEQAFSADGGNTWEANWIASVTRTQAEPLAPTADAPDRNHDFDFNLGKWKTHVSRLTPPLAGSTKWVEYDGTSELAPVWHGRALLFELRIAGSAGPLEGMGLRLYDPRAHRWNISWANSRDGMVGVPIIGEFRNGRGEFVDVEPFDGRQIFVRNVHSDIKPKSSRFEQAFSADGGKTWETNWVMTFEAAK